MDGLFQPGTTRVIRNPVSGRPRTRRAADGLARILGERGFRVELTRRPNHATDLARRAADEGCRSVICIGGDGTLCETVAELPADVAIGFFPTGTINLFALGLAIPRSVETWLALLATGAARPVYFGRCGGRPFASVASVGFDAGVVARVHPGLKKRIQEGAYVWQALRELPTYRVPRYEVRLDGERWDAPLVGVLIGKGPYYAGPHRVLPGADHTRDHLEVALLTGVSRRDLLRYAWGVRSGRLPGQRGVHLRRVRAITIRTEPASSIQLDGDAFSQTPAQLSCEPGPRRVLAPGPGL